MSVKNILIQSWRYKTLAVINAIKTTYLYVIRFVKYSGIIIQKPKDKLTVICTM